MKNMILFHTDLDRTLIYSRNVDIKSPKICVEAKNGEEFSYMTEYGYEMLHKLKDKMMIVPTTTRCIRQYNYIDLGYVPEFALVTNGGVLLVDGKMDEEWYNQSLEIAQKATSEIAKVDSILQKLDFENITRMEDDLFLMIRSDNPSELYEILKKELDLTKVNIYANRIKAYIIPKGIDKGNAIKRFRKYIEQKNISKTITAGDSDMDVPMLKQGDIAFAPDTLKELVSKEVNILPSGEHFLDGIMNYLEKQVE